jgi:LysM repeat protein
MRPGDSAAVVAMIYGVPEAAIRAANPTVDFNRLRPGDSINIPRAALVPSAAPLANPITPTIPAPVP